MPALAPGAAFAQGAAAALAPVAQDLDTVDEQVRSGQLRLDEGTARRLLASVAAVQSRVHELIADTGQRVDRPLRLGDNVIGRTMGERLRQAASGGTDAALPVLEEFSGQLEKLELIVRRAAGLIVAADEEASELLRQRGDVR